MEVYSNESCSEPQDTHSNGTKGALFPIEERRREEKERDGGGGVFIQFGRLPREPLPGGFRRKTEPRKPRYAG